MTPLTIPLPYPLRADDVQRAINRIAMWVALVHHKFNAKYSRDWLETNLRRYLREGWQTLAEKAVEAADKGDEIADGALRDIGAELQIAMLQKRDLQPGHLQIIAYYQRAGRRAPHKRRRGRYGQYDNWVRNCGICILVLLASAEFGVPETRHLDSRRANRDPSAISLVVPALARNQLNLDEGTVQRHIWFGIWGELMRHVAAERPVETWFNNSAV